MAQLAMLVGSVTEKDRGLGTQCWASWVPVLTPEI